MVKRVALSLGFTLVEMAIVLVIIGLLLSGGLLAVSPVLRSSKVSQTTQRIDRIEQALIVYTIRYGCLPCPADPTIASGSTNAGVSLAGGAYPAGTYCTGTVCDFATQGAVPWSSLGLSDQDATDGFSMRIEYAVGTGLQNTNGMVRTSPANYPSGNIVIDPSSGSTNQITSNAAYALISHGSDASRAYTTAGTGRITDPNGSADQADNGDGTPFVQHDENSTAGASYFDDIVRWRTAPLIIQLCGTNACGNPS